VGFLTSRGETISSYPSSYCLDASKKRYSPSSMGTLGVQVADSALQVAFDCPCRRRDWMTANKKPRQPTQDGKELSVLFNQLPLNELACEKPVDLCCVISSPLRVVFNNFLKLPSVKVGSRTGARVEQNSFYIS
jgi:hypothetical protein